MKSAVQNQIHTHTAFVWLNTYNCTACWKCMEVCPNDVIDKSFLFIADILIHQHALIYDTDKCIGCLKCLKTCQVDAIRIYK